MANLVMVVPSTKILTANQDPIPLISPAFKALLPCQEEERKVQTMMMYQLGQDWFQVQLLRIDAFAHDVEFWVAS